jgi:heptaprenylglyceryl phosphate synthase
MQELIIGFLTLGAIWFIINRTKKTEKKKTLMTLSRQSDVHRLLKHFFSISLANSDNSTQLTKHRQKGMIKVIVLGNQAYWVSNNKFYVAEAVNGEVQKSTTKPVDIDSLSKVDLDKMLFILDSLRDGKRNDRGSSGNQ